MAELDNQWALCLLKTVINEGRKIEESTRRLVGVSEESRQELRDTIDYLHDRYILIAEGHEQDVFPEFQLLCLRIQKIQQDLHWSLKKTIKQHGALTVVGGAITAVIKVIACAQTAVIGAIGLLSIGYVRSRMIVQHNEVRDELQSEGEDWECALRNILQQKADNRYRYAAIETFGMQQFQEYQTPPDFLMPASANNSSN